LSSLAEACFPALTESDQTGKRPKVSILLLAYNHVKYVGQALDSILMQKTEYDYVIHVVEDCSTDGTQDVIMRYAREHPGIVKPFLNPRNLGRLDPPSKKLQECLYQRLKELDGDYIAWLEGDDYWSSPHKLQNQVSFLESHPDFAAHAYNTVKIYDDGSNREPHRFHYSPDNVKQVHTVHDFVNMSSFFHLSAILYRNVFKHNPPVHFRSRYSCDIFLTMAYTQHGKLYHADEDASIYRQHKGGSYSRWSELVGRIYNLEGLRRYNRWLGYRYLRGYSFSINRLCLDLLRRSKDGRLPPLKLHQRLKFSLLATSHGLIYDLLQAYPRLSPAVFWYGEEPTEVEARSSLLARYLK
jgi:glycosyltransferase involved in cell wall biosynthesis